MDLGKGAEQKDISICKYTHICEYTVTNQSIGYVLIVFCMFSMRVKHTPQRSSTIGPRELPVQMAPMGPPRPEPPDPDLGAPLARSG